MRVLVAAILSTLVMLMLIAIVWISGDLILLVATVAIVWAAIMLVMYDSLWEWENQRRRGR